jgi:hypothetical protein
VALLHQSDSEPSESKLSFQIDEICAYLIEERVQSVSQAFRKEMDSMQKLIADWEGKCKTL